MSINKTAAATALAVGVLAGAGGLYAHNNTLNETFAKAGFDSSQLVDTCYLKLGNGDVVAGQPYALIGKTEDVNMRAVDTSQALFTDAKGNVIAVDASSMRIDGEKIVDHMTSYKATIHLDDVGGQFVMTADGDTALVRGTNQVVFSDSKIPSADASLKTAEVFASGASATTYLEMASNHYMDAIKSACSNGQVIKADYAPINMDGMNVAMDLYGLKAGETAPKQAMSQNTP